MYTLLYKMGQVFLDIQWHIRSNITIKLQSTWFIVIAVNLWFLYGTSTHYVGFFLTRNKLGRNSTKSLTPRDAVPDLVFKSSRVRF